MEERAFWKNRFLSLCLTLIFAVPLLAPLASADCMTTCDSVSGFSDCDDYDSTVYPGAAELCNGLDNDCDGDGCAVTKDISNESVLMNDTFTPAFIWM